MACLSCQISKGYHCKAFLMVAGHPLVRTRTLHKRAHARPHAPACAVLQQSAHMQPCVHTCMVDALTEPTELMAQAARPTPDHAHPPTCMHAPAACMRTHTHTQPHTHVAGSPACMPLLRARAHGTPTWLAPSTCIHCVPRLLATRSCLVLKSSSSLWRSGSSVGCVRSISSSRSLTAVHA